MSLENEIAFVSGASRGIGKEIALALGAKGATVVGTATSESGAENISNYLKENGIKGSGVMMNVTDQASIDTAVTTITEQFGAPTVLVNNAGTTRDTLLMMMKEDQWDLVIDTNLKSVFNCCKAVARSMVRQRSGRIVNITSVA